MQLRKSVCQLVLAVLTIPCTPVQGAVSTPAKTFPASAAHKAAVYSVDVIGDRIVVRGAYLGRVKVYVTPTGTGTWPTHVDDAKLGTAHGKSEEWFVTIPADPEESPYFKGMSDLHFRATDRSGHPVGGRYRLTCEYGPCQTAPKLYERLYPAFYKSLSPDDPGK